MATIQNDKGIAAALVRDATQALALSERYARVVETAARRVSKAVGAADAAHITSVRFTATRLQRAATEAFAALASLLAESGRLEALAAARALLEASGKSEK